MAQEQKAAEIARLEQEYGRYNATAGETAQILEETGSAADTAADRLASLNSVLSATQGAFELLSQAQKEQSETGYLSLDTVVKLLGEYPQLSGYLVEAASGYRLADGALQDYMAAQRAEYALALNDAQRAADAIVQAETDKINAIGATTATAKEQLLALSQLYQSMGANSDNLAEGVSYYAKANEYREAAQAIIDTTEALENFDRISASMFRESAGGGRGSASSSSSGRGKTQAELELEAFQEAVAELEHQRAMDQISEEAYYQEKAALGDQYLAHNKEARQELDEELYEWQKGAYERDLTALEEALEAESITWQEYLEGFQQARMEHLDEGSEEYAQALRTEQEETQRLKEEAYDQELADQQYFLDMGLISEEDFYTRMAQLRDQYLAEDSEAWRQANVQIRQYQQERQSSVFNAFLNEIQRAQQEYQELADKAEERYNDRVQELEDALDALKDALKDWYDAQKDAQKDWYDTQKETAKDAFEAKKEQIDQELELEKERLNAIIEGIDEEIQARRELREDEEQDDAIAKARKRLEAAQAQLAFARTEEDRVEWEKEVIRLQEALDQAIQDKEDTLFYREKEEEKEGIREQITAAEDAADKAKEEAEKEYEAELDRLEKEYEDRLQALEAEYNAELQRLEAEHQAALEQAKKEYQEDLSNAASGSAVGQPAEKKEEEEIDPEILDIARKEDVDLGVAKDMWEANQRYKDEPGYVPYGSGRSSSSSSGLEKAASALAGAVESAARSLSGAVNQVTKNNSANITYNTSGGMTEGQVARTVRKVLDELDK